MTDTNVKNDDPTNTTNINRRIYRIVKLEFKETEIYQVQYRGTNFDFWNTVSDRDTLEEAMKLVEECKVKEVISEEEVWSD